MKMHTSKNEKQTIQELIEKLEGKEFKYDTIQEDLSIVLGEEIEVWENDQLGRIYYQWVLYYRDIELGLDVEGVGETSLDDIENSKYIVSGFRWSER